MEITEIKSHLKIEKVLQYYGLKANRNKMLSCPFHDEKQASMKIYPETDTFNCFGCKANGDVIEFIQLKEKISKHEALKKATELINPMEGRAQTPQPLRNESISQVKQLDRNDSPSLKASSNNEKVELLTKLFTYFRGAINNSKPSRDYITEKRKLELFLEIGYNSGQFHHGQRRDVQLIEECVKYGMLTPTQSKTKSGNSTGYYVFGKNCIVFPLKDKDQQITGLYFRSITDDTSTKPASTESSSGKHYYLKNREGLYPGYPSPQTTRLILTEAIIDAATLLQLPFIMEAYAVLSCYGTNGFTKEHKEAVTEWMKQPTFAKATVDKEIIIFFDGDKTGTIAAKKLAKQLRELNNTLRVKIVDTPEGEDINGLLMGHDTAIFSHLLDTAPFFLLPEEVSEKAIFSDKENKITQVPPSPQEINTPISGTLLIKSVEQFIYDTSEFIITIWGGIEKENLSRLKVSMHVKSKQNKYRSFRDDVNLYSHSSVQKLIQNLSETLEVGTSLVDKTLTDLTESLEAYRMDERAKQVRALQPKGYEMSEQEKQQSMDFLKTRGSGKRTLELIRQSGLIGEEKNGLLLFFLYLSRLLDDPLHAIIFGKSGSGKTYLQTRVSECLPEESVRMITSLTENTLYYSQKGFWKHKVLLIEDLEGVYNAFLPLREFMSKQSITKLTTDKDVKGNNVQKLLTVEGPICVSGATTQGSIYEDNANRSFLLHIDESAGHLKHVMEYQRKLQAGVVNQMEQETAKKVLKNAQRLLRKVKIINPYAMDLRIPDCVFKKLRTNMHYLKLIEIITFYMQYQRKWKKSKDGEYYIETAIEDIELANFLVKDNLLRKSDELNEDTRYFFESLKDIIKSKPETAQCFYSKQIREHFRLSPMKVNRYLHQLESRGYIERTGGNRKTGYEYEIVAWDEYEQLKSGVDVLDEIVVQLKEKEKEKRKQARKVNGNPALKTDQVLSVTRV